MSNCLAIQQQQSVEDLLTTILDCNLHISLF